MISNPFHSHFNHLLFIIFKVADSHNIIKLIMGQYSVYSHSNYLKKKIKHLQDHKTHVDVIASKAKDSKSLLYFELFNYIEWS